MLSWLTGPSVPEVDIHEADRRVDAGAQMVDVREQEEWDEAHVPGSIHIPLARLPQRAAELDASREVVVICRSGNRSKTGVKMLNRAGFTDASSMAGGIVAWGRAGKPIER